MKKVTFLITMAFFIAVSSIFIVQKHFIFATSTQTDTSEIDRKIQEFEDLKMGFEGRAEKHENDAQRLQFQGGELQNAKKHWKAAELNREGAAKVQQNINELKAKKETILKEQH